MPDVYGVRFHDVNVSRPTTIPSFSSARPQGLTPFLLFSYPHKRMKFLFETLVVIILAPWVSSWTIPFTKRATVCNGHAELCGRTYSNLTYVGAHDSFAYSVDPLALGRNQEVDISTQLTLGVRLLQAQSHINPQTGQLHFCHTNCFIFDGGNVTSYLRTVKTWLDANPNEVITFIFTNPENVSLLNFWKPAFDDSGISPMAYIPPTLPVKQSEWPTLGTLIDSGKRVIVFMDTGANTTAVPFILPEFQMIWETPFSVTDSAFPCRVDRMHGPLVVEDHTYMINHSLNVDILPNDGDVIIPDRMNAQRTNGMASILSHIQNCTPLGANRNPQFILLDWVHIGDGFRVADMLNGVPTPPPSNSTLGKPSGGPRSRSVSSHNKVAVLLACFMGVISVV